MRKSSPVSFVAAIVLIAGIYSPAAAQRTVVVDNTTRPEFRGALSRQWMMLFSPDGKDLAMTSGWALEGELHEPGELLVWDIATKRIKLVLRQDGAIRSTAFSLDGKILAMGDFLGGHCFLERATGKVIHEFPKHGHIVNAIAFLPDKKTYVSSSFDSSVKFWDIESHNLLETLEIPNESIVSMAVSPDGKRLAAGTKQGNLHAWTVDDKKLAYSNHICKAYVECLGFSPDGKTLASGDWGNNLILWEADTGKKIRDLVGHQRFVQGAVFFPDGKNLASIDAGGHVMVWTPDTGVRQATWQAYRSSAHGLAISSDGSLIATTSQSGAPKLWDAKTLKLVADLPQQ